MKLNILVSFDSHSAAEPATEIILIILIESLALAWIMIGISESYLDKVPSFEEFILYNYLHWPELHWDQSLLIDPEESLG